MSEYKDIATNVVVYRPPELEKITPNSGPNAGKEIDVLTLKTYHPNFERTDDGKWKQIDSDFYVVKVYGDVATRFHQHVKEGMTLEIRGSLTERTYEGKDGQKHTESLITTRNIGLSLNQAGLKSIDYEKPEKKVGKADELER